MRIVMPCLHVEPWARLRSACCAAPASVFTAADITLKMPTAGLCQEET